MAKKQPPTIVDTKYFTTRELCARLHCHRSTLPRKIAQGLLPPHVKTRMGQENLYVRADVYRLEEKNRQAPVETEEDEASDGSQHPIDRLLPKIEREHALAAVAERAREREAKETERAKAKEADRRTRELMKELHPKAHPSPRS